MDRKFLEVSEIKLRGIKEIEGMKFHDIEGGFGEGKKAMLVKEIAEIHNRDLKDINRNINNNIYRFKKGVDIVDLKNGDFDSPLKELGFSKRDVSISNNIYLLSERGYSKLLKILEDDFAWEQYEKLVDGYFNMRLEKKQLSPMEQLKLQYQVLDEHEEKINRIEEKVDNEINEVKKEMKDLKDNEPLYNIECKELQGKVKQLGIQLMGGNKQTNAYNNKSLRGKIYADIQREIKRQFQVTRYEAIKRRQLSIAYEILENYRLPMVLKEEVIKVNNQVSFEEAM